MLCIRGFCNGSESTCKAGDGRRYRFYPCNRKISYRKKWKSTPVILTKKPLGQSTLVVYSSWGHKESNMTNQLCASLCEHTHMWCIIYYIFSILWLLLAYLFCFVNLWSILVLWYTFKNINSFKIYFKIKLDKFYLVTLNILNKYYFKIF